MARGNSVFYWGRTGPDIDDGIFPYVFDSENVSYPTLVMTRTVPLLTAVNESRLKQWTPRTILVVFYKPFTQHALKSAKGSVTRYTEL